MTRQPTTWRDPTVVQRRAALGIMRLAAAPTAAEAAGQARPRLVRLRGAAAVSRGSHATARQAEDSSSTRHGVAAKVALPLQMVAVAWWLACWCARVQVCAGGSGTGRPPDVTPPAKMPLGVAGVTADMLPEPYVGTTVAGLVVTMDASNVREYNGVDKDMIVVDIAGQGPTLFSLPRWNQGDFAPRLQPRHPYAQPNLGRLIMGGTGSESESPLEPPAQAWRPSIEKGVMLASVAQNGRQWNDSSPFFYGTVACVYASHGYGYSMDTGEFGNDNPNMNVAVGRLGKELEANIDVGVAWFPYHQGWMAGYVAEPEGYSSQPGRWTSTWSFSPSLPQDASQVVQWDDWGAWVTLPHVDARHDGMLFLTSTNPGPGNNDGNTVSMFVDGRRWRVQVREDDQADPSILAGPVQAMFAFLYIPYTAAGLIGGMVSGSSGVAAVRIGRFESQRLAKGMYEIRVHRIPNVFENVQPLSNRDGMVLLQVVDRDLTDKQLTRHCVLSYSIATNGSIIVQAHKLEILHDDVELYPFVDTDFYFAWVDFRTPLTPSVETYTGRLPHMTDASDFSSGITTAFSLFLFLVVAVGAVLGALALSRRLTRRSIFSLVPLAPSSRGGIVPASPGADGDALTNLLLPRSEVEREAEELIIEDPEHGHRERTETVDHHDSGHLCRSREAAASQPSLQGGAVDARPGLQATSENQGQRHDDHPLLPS